MRVIGGRLKGRRLISPAGMLTRPTADRIRESIFNILADRPVNQHVLDLFAGTGALGIEALSRGAATAVFIDQAKAAMTAIQRNIEQLNLDRSTRVIRWNVRRNLNCLRAEPASIDLVFMDPPYDTDAVAPALHSLASCGVLAPGALIVIEHSLREDLPTTVDRLTLRDQRRFGRTLVSFMDTVL